MEFPELGTNCNWSSCKALDFLPITCTFCGLVFCKEHFNPTSHQCTKTDSVNYEGCKSKTFICSFQECGSKSPVEMICPKCSGHFCLDHRYHDCFNVSEEEVSAQKKKLKANKEQFAESIKEVNSIVNEGIRKAQENPKKKSTALKVQLMRLKGKAVGSSGIPSTDRIYFLALLPKSSKNLKSKPVFVSKDWSVGRVIDSISSTCNVTNKNNEMNSPKLRIFKKSDGLQISTDMSQKLEDLINQDCIQNGETVILEYVQSNEDLNSYQLSNFKEYVES